MKVGARELVLRSQPTLASFECSDDSLNPHETGPSGCWPPPTDTQSAAQSADSCVNRFAVCEALGVRPCHKEANSTASRRRGEVVIPRVANAGCAPITEARIAAGRRRNGPAVRPEAAVTRKFWRHQHHGSLCREVARWRQSPQIVVPESILWRRSLDLRSSQEQAILRRDALRNRLRVDGVSRARQPTSADDINGQRPIHPAAQPALIR